MDFLRYNQPEKFIYLNYKIGKALRLPLFIFPVGKDIPQWVASQQSPSLFLFTREMYKELFEYINLIINRKFSKPNLVSTIFMKGQSLNSKLSTLNAQRYTFL